MEAGVAILEAEERLDLGEEAARTDDRRRGVGQGRGHEADDARVLGLAQRFVLEVRHADAGGDARDELDRFIASGNIEDLKTLLSGEALQLRKKFGDLLSLDTVWGVGYRMG